MNDPAVTHCGFPLGAWDAARIHVTELLSARAKAGKTISYSEVVALVHEVHSEPDSHALAAMLGEIAKSEDEAGRGMLSVAVVHKTGNMMPGPGFFELASKLGKDVSDKEKMWVEEFRKVVSLG